MRVSFELNERYPGSCGVRDEATLEMFSLFCSGMKEGACDVFESIFPVLRQLCQSTRCTLYLSGTRARRHGRWFLIFIKKKTRA